MLMKILLVVLLACLAGLEYFHHRSHGHGAHEQHATTMEATPEAKAEKARELLRQHRYQH